MDFKKLDAPLGGYDRAPPRIPRIRTRQESEFPLSVPTQFHLLGHSPTLSRAPMLTHGAVSLRKRSRTASESSCMSMSRSMRNFEAVGAPPD